MRGCIPLLWEGPHQHNGHRTPLSTYESLAVALTFMCVDAEVVMLWKECLNIRSLAGLVQVQGHAGGVQVLVHHPQQLAIYSVETAKRESVWAPHDGSTFARQKITAATYSADGVASQVIAAFSDGSLAVLDGTSLAPLCQIPLSVLDPSLVMRPTALAAQPVPGGLSRVAVGSSTGSVLLLEVGAPALTRASSPSQDTKPVVVSAGVAASVSAGEGESQSPAAATAKGPAASGAVKSGAADPAPE